MSRYLLITSLPYKMLTNAKHSKLFHQIIAIQVQLFEVEPNDHDARHVKYLWLTFLFLFKKKSFIYSYPCIHLSTRTWHT